MNLILNILTAVISVAEKLKLPTHSLYELVYKFDDDSIIIGYPTSVLEKYQDIELLEDLD